MAGAGRPVSDPAARFPDLVVVVAGLGSGIPDLDLRGSEWQPLAPHT